MPVITAAEVEYSLRQPHEPCAWPMELASELIAPRYDGYSLANVPATVATILGHPVPGMRPLAPLYWADLASGVTKVVVLLLDALGYMRLQQMMHTSSSCIWTQLAANGVLYPMTSVCPSTTTTALTCLNTGVEPISHGLVGYELWLREYGILAEMLSLKAAYGTGRETLLDWGFVPEQFLPVPGIGERFTELGIRSTCMISSQYIQSALSRMLYRGFQRSVGYHDADDMWSGLHDMIAQDDATPSYYFVYWSTIDTAIHRYGSSGGYWQAELQNVTRTMQDRFLEPLSPAERRGVLFVMMADHGWMDTPIEAAFDVEANWQLRRELLGPASGEARSAYLHCLNGADSAVQDRIQAALGSDYVVANSALAQQAGLWGTAAPMAEIQARLGHLLVLSRGQHYLDRQGKRNRLRGRHGGLSPEEMLVPWLAMRLDG